MVANSETAVRIVPEHEPELEKEEEKQCIYGSDVKNPCPVRSELSKPKLARWMLPKANASMLEQASEMMQKLSEGMVEHTLVSFCEECPHLILYTNKKHYELVKKGEAAP